MKKSLQIGLLGLALVWGSYAQAQDNSGVFIQPLDCTLGEDCWIPNYVDLKGGQGVLDYKCGDASYDAEPGARHKGTDFAIRDMRAATKGVEVFAAAAGKVVGARDGVVDEKYHPHSHGDDDHTHAAETQECGNGVRIEHAGGLFTQYCHMRQGSVTVKPGQAVQQGEVLGLVGLSGQTAFPHLHFQVSHGERIVDPFVGLKRQNTCDVGENPLWTAEALAGLPYKPTAIFNAGFAPDVLDRDDLLTGANRAFETEAFPSTAPVLLAWVEMFRVREGDRVVFTITNPDGSTFQAQTVPIKARKAYQYLYTGKRLTEKAWPKGTYTAKIELIQGLDSFVAERKMEIR